jgi:hypothetical protein
MDRKLPSLGERALPTSPKTVVLLSGEQCEGVCSSFGEEIRECQTTGTYSLEKRKTSLHYYPLSSERCRCKASLRSRHKS